jgi:hypothetical protein
MPFSDMNDIQEGISAKVAFAFQGIVSFVAGFVVAFIQGIYWKVGHSAPYIFLTRTKDCSYFDSHHTLL